MSRSRNKSIGTDPRKQSLYFPEDDFEWLKAEAERLDRSYSWVVQACLRIAKAEIEGLPTQKVWE